MSQSYKLSSPLRARLFSLLRQVNEDGVPDPGDGFLGLSGLSEDSRRLHLIVSLYEQERQLVQAKKQAAPKRSEAAPPIAEATGAAPAPMLTPMPLSSVLPEFEERAPPPPSAESVSASAAVPPPPTPQPTLPVEVPSQAPPMLMAPQSGGVPSLPPGLDAPPPSMIEMIKKTVYLKNARVNEAYDEPITVSGLKGLKLDDDGGSGLTLDAQSGRLNGLPSASGDFVIRLQGLLDGKRAEIFANLAVIPDPKSLWISKDSNRDDPYWKPDHAFARAEGRLLCVAASKRGRSHAKDGSFRDDDFGLWTDGANGWHIAVVADGAGSAAYSRRGSKIAVDSVLRDLPALLDDHLLPHLGALVGAYQQGHPDAASQIKSQLLYPSLAAAAFNAVKAIEAEAAAKGEKVSAFSTTLIITIARKMDAGWFIGGFSIGDGGAAVFDVRDRSLTTLTVPDSGEFAGQTRFLHRSEFAQYADVEKRLFFDVRQYFTAIALMTDGISDPKFPTESVFADPDRWIEFWNTDLAAAVDFVRSNPTLEAQFLDWLDFWSPGNHDDRTLAVLVP